MFERYLNIDAEEGDQTFENISSVHVEDYFGESTGANAGLANKAAEFTGETSFYVREQYVLAHSNNVDIVSNTNFIGHKLLKGLKFYKVITKR